MLRPARVASGCRALIKSPLFAPCRTKVIYVESFLDKAERIKLFNMENKLLFGPLLETQKAKAKRTKASKSVKTDIHDVITGTKSLKMKAIKKPKKFDMKKVEVPSFLYNVEDNTFSKKTSSRIDLIDSSSMLSSINIKKPDAKIVASNPKNSIFTSINFVVPSIIVRNLKTFPMMRNQKMDWKDKKADTPNDNKILKISWAGEENAKFPSVSKILETSMSEEAKAALERWKQKKIEELGLEGFEKFNKAQMDQGKRFHGLLSDYFLSSFNTSNVDSSLEGVWTSVAHVLKELSSPKAIESHVVHPVLKYKGVIDCIASFQDKPTLIEWKKSDKPKPALSATFDNPVQLAAYFGAVSHDTNYKQLNVKDALLVIAYTDGAPADIFHLNVDQMRQHWAAWLTRLEKFLTATEIKDVTPK